MLLVAGRGMAPAQTATGVLRGTLADDSGAVIPSATVRLSGNGLQKTAITAADGSYAFPGLQPGTYAVQVQFPGFASFQGTVTVSAGRTQELPIRLAVSLEKQEVTVLRRILTTWPGTTAALPSTRGIAWCWAGPWRRRGNCGLTRS